MNIGIDARLIEETGVGRYIRNLVWQLARIDHRNRYVVFLRKKSFDTFQPPNVRWTKVLADVPWHTVREQLMMPGLCRAQKLDLLHVPYYNPPVFYTGRVVITIHDLTILHFATGKATTLPFGLYALKHMGYRAVLRIALSKAANVIAVSETTKQEILDHFRINPARITVTYEGVDAYIHARDMSNKQPLISGKYFLYVGNAYPHKNVEILLKALVHMPPDYTLVLVGTNDLFYERLKQSSEALGLSGRVRFFGSANDGQLSNLYRNAQSLLFPSLMEGFGLPGVEALSVGCPVIASDIPIFHEILKNFATYFHPRDVSGLAARLVESVRSRNDADMVKKRKEYAQKYSWERMARETLEVYERSARI